MMTSSPHFDVERCNDRHRNLTWVFGILFLVVLATAGIFGTIAWNSMSMAQSTDRRVVTESREQTDRVATVARDLAVEIRATNEFRGSIAQTLGELREWMKATSQKQDQMNDALLRLLHEKKTPEGSK